ncbi:hypothetical protein [Variovorax sp. TBS-050B]|jgi:hypothetical protein|uniref:DUF7661 family protein n=1 Tax=Variovorax sp. TBS-050B TaxID=2940551 RepID=UPI00247493BA|nr:hypothetical protein [Variovorax sp. TBS-050B]
MHHLFNVFGQLLRIERAGDAWRASVVSADGKRRPAELAIPSDLPRGELAQYLYDIYHENATPTNGDVFEVDAR